MYLKLVLATCLLTFFAVVLSAYARLSDAGLGCSNWPACYEENALKERQRPQTGAVRGHASWQWKLHGQVVQLLGILAIAVCGLSWKKRKESGQSPLLPILYLALMVFMAAFGILSFHYLPRPIIVSVHLAGGIAMLTLLVWIALNQMAAPDAVGAVDARKLRTFSWFGFVLLLFQILLGGWVSANFAALACTDLPLCKGSLLPQMDFSYSPGSSAAPPSMEQLVAIHWMHRIVALLTFFYLGWLSTRVMAVEVLRKTGKAILGLVVFQFLLGISNVLTGLSQSIAVLHNALAMLLTASMVLLLFRLQHSNGGDRI